LAKLVKERQFRADLFYRLNVFPISLPPLRDRSEDIPELVWHFVRVFSRRLNRDINVISDEVMDVIRTHQWPGNIRELQNFLERAVIMSPGSALLPPMDDLEVLATPHAPSLKIPTFAQAQRDHILDVLERVDWVIGGREGAAARLALPRTTLLYRMSKLGIKPRRLANVSNVHCPDREDF
jgi:formate hydrogenlyase transcriptional activator